MPFPWWGGSVAEGIFLISAERNADRVLGVAFVSRLYDRGVLCSVTFLLTVSYFRLPSSAT
jgi:hypothetical protein